MTTTNVVENEKFDGSSREVYEIPGEPAIVVNGLPNACTSSGNEVFAKSNAPFDGESESEKGFGEWLEGRKVRKLFGEKYYLGVVTEYDNEEGWYKVVYEDGDSEDLDWRELEDVILPLDVMVPLKDLALKLVNKTGQRLARSKSRPA